MAPAVLHKPKAIKKKAKPIQKTPIQKTPIQKTPAAPLDEDDDICFYFPGEEEEEAELGGLGMEYTFEPVHEFLLPTWEEIQEALECMLNA